MLLVQGEDRYTAPTIGELRGRYLSPDPALTQANVPSERERGWNGDRPVHAPTHKPSGHRQCPCLLKIQPQPQEIKWSCEQGESDWLWLPYLPCVFPFFITLSLSLSLYLPLCTSLSTLPTGPRQSADPSGGGSLLRPVWLQWGGGRLALLHVQQPREGHR